MWGFLVTYWIGMWDGFWMVRCNLDNVWIGFKGILNGKLKVFCGVFDFNYGLLKVLECGVCFSGVCVA